MNKNNSVHTDVKYEVYNMRKGNNVLCGIFHDYCKDFYNNHHNMTKPSVESQRPSRHLKSRWQFHSEILV